MNARYLAQLFADYFNVIVKYHFAIVGTKRKSILIESSNYTRWLIKQQIKYSLKLNSSKMIIRTEKYYPRGCAPRKYELSEQALKVCIDNNQEVFWYAEVLYPDEYDFLPNPMGCEAYFGTKYCVSPGKDNFPHRYYPSFHTHLYSPLLSEVDFYNSSYNNWHYIIGTDSYGGAYWFRYKFPKGCGITHTLKKFDRYTILDEFDKAKVLWEFY